MQEGSRPRSGRLLTRIYNHRPRHAPCKRRCQATRTSNELRELGLANQRLVNGVFKASDASDRIAHAIEALGKKALAALPADLRPLPQEHTQIDRVQGGLAKRVFGLPWQPDPPVGLAALSKLTA